MSDNSSADTSPSLAFYAQLQRAYDHFNARLFGGDLPSCLITLRSSGRQHGYHHSERFINAQGKTLDELALHPGQFTLRAPEEVLSTLVHEMVHHWQSHFGRPSRSNPHNREWGFKMLEVGLEPSSTGLPGGKQTGTTVSHYILPGGRYVTACRELLGEGFEIPWYDRHVPRATDAAQMRQKLQKAGVAVPVSPAPMEVLTFLETGEKAVIEPAAPKPPTRMRYVCGLCGAQAWAAPTVALVCEPCGAPLLKASLVAEMTTLKKSN